MNRILSIILTIAVLVTIGLSYFTIQKVLTYWTIDSCLALGKTQYTAQERTFTGPDLYWYEYCMKEKGLKK